MPLVPLPDRHDDRVTATVTYVDPAYRYCRATDADGHDYFIFHNAFAATDYRDISDVVIGTVVKLSVIEHPKGLRGVDVAIVSG